jgi:hypothetical protein
MITKEQAVENVEKYYESKMSFINERLEEISLKIEEESKRGGRCTNFDTRHISFPLIQRIVSILIKEDYSVHHSNNSFNISW